MICNEVNFGTNNCLISSLSRRNHLTFYQRANSTPQVWLVWLHKFDLTKLKRISATLCHILLIWGSKSWNLGPKIACFGGLCTRYRFKFYRRANSIPIYWLLWLHKFDMTKLKRISAGLPHISHLWGSKRWNLGPTTYFLRTWDTYIWLILL